jgi:hypothetical protein
MRLEDVVAHVLDDRESVGFKREFESRWFHKRALKTHSFAHLAISIEDVYANDWQIVSYSDSPDPDLDVANL